MPPSANKTLRKPPDPSSRPGPGPITRSTTKTTARSTPPVTTQPDPVASTQAQPAHLSDIDEDQPMFEATALFIISQRLKKLVDEYELPDELERILLKLSRFAGKNGIKAGKKEILQVCVEDVRELRQDLVDEISTNYKTLEAKLADLASSQDQILKVTNAITKEAEGLNKAAKKIEHEVTKVTDTTDQIATTTKSYKDAVLANPNAPPGSMANLRILDDLERKAKQILVEVHGDTLSGKSLTEIRDKANKAISEIDADGDDQDDQDDPLGKVEVDFVTKIRGEAILLQLNSKLSADWLRDPIIESKFIEKFANDSYFVDRKYSIIVPRTPITFEPENEANLRELEEGNNLGPHEIVKAKWIKPVNKRREGQTHAYATIVLNSPVIANLLIRKGIQIHGVRTRPTKMTKQPTQCMRCRYWGHLAYQCLNAKEACGGCGEEHSTSNCNNPQKRYCVSCKSSTHASWDRNCPEFIRRRDSMNEKYPENNLPFFPTDEEWTLTTRSDNIPLENRFPKQYAVNILPPSTTAKHLRPQTHNKPKRQGKQGTQPGQGPQGNGTNPIEKYFTRPHLNSTQNSSSAGSGDTPVPAHQNHPNTTPPAQTSGNAPPGNNPGWN